MMQQYSNNNNCNDNSRSRSTKSLVYFEKETPDKLKDNNSGVNTDKTEKQHVSGKNKDVHWKKSKYLGSLLGTEEDIKRRMGLAISYNKFKDVLESNKIGNITKARIYRMYVESILM